MPVKYRERVGGRNRKRIEKEAWGAELQGGQHSGECVRISGTSPTCETGYEMTGIRLSIRAFKNLQLYSSSLTYSSSQCLTCWTHCRRLSNCLANRQPSNNLLHTNSNGFLTTLPAKPFLYAVRHKGKKIKKQNKTQSSQEDDDNDEEEADQEDVSDYEDEPAEDPSIPKDYKDLEKAVQSFRFDVVLTAGLDMSRNKIEEAFYDGKLRLNGEKLWKKSRAVKVGDTLDLIVEENREAGTITVMRTILKDVLKDKTSTEKFKVLLRRWKKLTVPKTSEAPKPTGVDN